MEAARGDGGLLPDLPERLGDRRRAERRATREEGVEDRPQGVDVGRRPGPPRFAAGLLGGHVTWGPQDQARPRDPAVCVEHLGQAEVGDLRPAVMGQQDVRGLEVAVDDAQAVRVVDRPGQGLHQLGRLAGRQRGAVAAIVETAAIDVLELQVGPAVVIAQVMDLDDRRVLQARDRLGLGQKAGRGLGPGVGAGQDHLQGADPVQVDLARLVNDAHTAAAQLPEDHVARHLRQAPAGVGRLGDPEGGELGLDPTGVAGVARGVRPCREVGHGQVLGPVLDRRQGGDDPLVGDRLARRLGDDPIRVVAVEPNGQAWVARGDRLVDRRILVRWLVHSSGPHPVGVGAPRPAGRHGPWPGHGHRVRPATAGRRPSPSVTPATAAPPGARRASGDSGPGPPEAKSLALSLAPATGSTRPSTTASRSAGPAGSWAAAAPPSGAPPPCPTTSPIWWPGRSS